MAAEADTLEETTACESGQHSRLQAALLCRRTGDFLDYAAERDERIHE